MTVNNLIALALAVSLVTFILTAQEVYFGARSKVFKTIIINPAYWLYFVFHLLGNILATIFAAYLIKDKLEGVLFDIRYLIYGILGIFIFSGILSNSDIKLFGTDILIIGTIVDDARLSAIDQAKVLGEVERKKYEFHLAVELRQVKEFLIDDIDVILKELLSEDESLKLEKDIKSGDWDPFLYKCLLLVAKNPVLAKLLVERSRKERGRRRTKIFPVDGYGD
jgi:hypothetical protein